ncbi:MAG: lytic transglycosylase domain-containing protein [Thermodesulfobacteriota bacterium]
MVGLFILLMIKLSPSLAPGKIVRYIDGQGVLHITTSDQEQPNKSHEPKRKGEQPGPGETLVEESDPETAAAMDPAPAAEPSSEPKPGAAKMGPSPEPGALGQQSSTQPEIRIHNGGTGKIEDYKGSTLGSTLAVVSSLPATHPVMHPATTTPVSAAQGGVVLTFKDYRGVIHITNSSDTTGPDSQRYAKGESPQSPGLISGPLQAIQPVSWQPPFASRSPAIAAASEAASIVAREPAIRRFRDRLGVVHINNAAPPGRTIPVVDLATREIKATAPSPVQAGPIQVPPAYALLRAAGIFHPRPVADQSSVKSHRDRHGIIRIFNPPAQEFTSYLAGPPASVINFKDSLEPIIAEATRIYRLPSALVKAVIKMESNFVPWAVSPKGAMGLMQLMPETASDLGVRDPFNPRENVLAGCRYLRTLLDQFQGSLPLAVAAYNAGNQRVIAAGYTIPSIKETQEFVTGVMGLYYLMEKMEKTGHRL